MIQSYFNYFKQRVTGLEQPHLHYKENENVIADVIVAYKPLFLSLKSKYKLISEEDFLTIYTHCVLKSLNRFILEKANFSFGVYLKFVFVQQCNTKMTSLERDKRKINLGTYNIDDVFKDDNFEVDSAIDKDNLLYYSQVIQLV